MMLGSFSYVGEPSVHSPWERVYSGPLPIFLIGLFVFLVLNCMSSLYILEFKPLSDISLVNVFSHTVTSLFILMMVSLFLRLYVFILRKREMEGEREGEKH